MPPPGRPPLSRRVFDLGTLPPEAVVLDTSAVVCALLEDQPHHEDYAGFLERAIEADTWLVYSELVTLELAETCICAPLREAHGRQWQAHRNDGRALRPGRQLMREVQRRWEATLSLAQTAPVPLTDVHEAAARLMRTHAIRSYDAAHAATTLLVGSPIVARDNGFARVPTLDLITDAPRVPVCRRIRAAIG